MIPKTLAAKDNGSRIFSLELADDKRTVMVGEECDNYFCVHLTKSEFAEVIAEMQELQSQMADAPPDGDKGSE